MDNKKAIIQVVGYKNSGKTTTCCKIIERFVEQGWKVGSIKNDAHNFEVDHPGKDTWLHREAGASVVAITSKHKTAIMEQRPTRLEHLIERMDGIELVVIEGYKFENYPKVVLLRNESDLSLVEETTEIMAIASWFPYEHPSIPVVHIDQFPELFTIIYDYVQNEMGGNK
ncbi:molybdopterin-guanine dinucleotide biosynthesis protein B [Ammoniphilus oxalaticus]|uniref:Molybdopterin-guanine dinucleotide biosynthesis protein B n=1 Tax=Ammoniphilus oxalaticus TaxID=66863 RepID=A0A419SEE6_9BACL|nr:molybdopterin-guanine dinucleotide biosynthesis protein B [Ammoniphilus oxalaticus]RKD21683.1 molybdopterin-guanine dinucleotide biosynthesis protein B [Ammoniphilus oxalaticus]